ncbi:MAG: hypothetical protein PHR68_01515 [Candidatus Gracilibacteria bacterium]|nr:hypothetical protein [Candidatus Gracilibacteria bacterium]
MLSKEAIEDLKTDCSFEEIQRINQSLERFEKDGIAYDLDEAFAIVEKQVFSKYMANV